MRRATITGWGRYTPPAVLTNDDLALLMDTSDEWITSRSGIKERRVSHVSNAEMATAAARHAVAAAGIDPQDIDLVVIATCTPDRAVPSVAAYVQRALGIERAGAFDVNAACSGFVYGLSICNGMMRAGTATRALLVGAERLSAHLDFGERSTAVLFGDGAGAVVLEATEGPEGLLSTNVNSDAGLADALTITGSGTEIIFDPTVRQTVQMDGREIFRNAVVRMGEATAKAIADAGLDLDDVDLLIAHQANIRIIDATAKRLKLDPARIFTNIASYGNTSAASVPIAIAEAADAGVIKPGDIVAFTAFGGGLTWAAAVLRWGNRVSRVATVEDGVEGTSETALELLAKRRQGLGV